MFTTGLGSIPSITKIIVESAISGIIYDVLKILGGIEMVYLMIICAGVVCGDMV